MTEVDRVVSRARRGRTIFVGLFILLCLSGIAYAIVVNFQQDTKITKVERSACAQAPASRECQKVKRRSDRQRSIADTCIAFWKVGYRCPAPSSGISAPARGGDALQPAPAGQQPPPAKAPAHNNGDVEGHAHPQPDAVAPEAPVAETPEAASPPATGRPAGEEAAGSPTAPAAESTAPESGTGLLDDPGGTVGKIVCSVNALGLRVCTE
ncbi:MAG TPA: hypothetical protein VN758_00505 [Solirubrobacterales bacterium]|nr:hypothetical protein [Solirubrobacterales bacterium]